jgi:hypothetical protein
MVETQNRVQIRPKEELHEHQSIGDTDYDLKDDEFP